MDYIISIPYELNVENYMSCKYSMPVLFVLLLSGCVEIPKFDDTPAIVYNGVDQYTEIDEVTNRKIRENVIITVDFKDGDGDLGASSAERVDTSFIEKYGNWGNYELVTIRKELDGSWTESILSEDRIKWLPLLKPDGKAGPLKGKLDLALSYNYANSTVPVTLKYKVRIRDRSLRVSNQIETDTVSVPGYR